MRVAIQMNPIERIAIQGDTTFALALEAQRRGIDLLVYEPPALQLADGVLSARLRAVRLRDAPGRHVEAGERALIALRSMDLILMRQDPPFDLAYITATHLLEHVQPETLVVNDPAGVRNAPEKLLCARFAGLMPPTLISADGAALRDFHRRTGEVVLKPLYGGGGEGIQRLRPGDENANGLIDMMLAHYRTALVMQAYLPQVRAGDKRIVMLEGKPVGALNRLPQPGEARANMRAGGRAVLAELSPREEEICAALGPELRARGLILAGIDVIGGWLTEINVTSPTGLREIAREGGPDIAALFWDAIEARLAGDGRA